MVNDTQEFEVVIIGGGPGGYVAAIRAAQLGLKIAVVERENLGGVCLNWGCIPTKALLKSSELYHHIQHAEDFGLSVKDVKFDLKKIVERSRNVSGQLAGGIGHLLKKHKVTVFEGHGSLNGKNKVKVLDSKGNKVADLTAPHIIISTGARARTLPGLEPDGKRMVTYRDAMVPKTMPKSLLVIGSGAIGIEFASFYNTLGVDVTLVEVAPRILPVEDSEISGLAQKAFEAQGMNILTNTEVKQIEQGAQHITASLVTNGSEKSTIDVERIILAVGVVPNTENLGLEGTKVQFRKGHIKTDEWMQTDEKGVYAIGDVTAPPWLAHKASHEGVICVEKIAGVEGVHPMKKENIPGCTYCAPQIASIGLTEEQAKEEGLDVKVGRFPYLGNGKAIAMNEPEGLIKTIFDKESGELVGAHMIGAEVTELIAAFSVGKTMEATELDFMHTVFAHPTLSEMMHESVLAAFGRALHI